MRSHRPSGVGVGPVMALVMGTMPAAASPPSPDSSSPALGPGYLEMVVAGVVPSGNSHTLVLVNSDEEVLLPLGIGLAEAMSIHGRLRHKVPSRPLTHDLLDHILGTLGGEVVRVQIDDLQGDVFTGTVVIRIDGRTMVFDARPSDAVALALGNRAPIFVARPVVGRAALRPEDLERIAESHAPPSVPATRFDSPASSSASVKGALAL